MNNQPNILHRPKRSLKKKISADILGLSWREEKELRKAMYESLKCTTNADGLNQSEETSISDEADSQKTSPNIQSKSEKTLDKVKVASTSRTSPTASTSQSQSHLQHTKSAKLKASTEKQSAKHSIKPIGRSTASTNSNIKYTKRLVASYSKKRLQKDETKRMQLKIDVSSSSQDSTNSNPNSDTRSKRNGGPGFNLRTRRNCNTASSKSGLRRSDRVRNTPRLNLTRSFSSPELDLLCADLEEPISRKKSQPASTAQSCRNPLSNKRKSHSSTSTPPPPTKIQKKCDLQMMSISSLRPAIKLARPSSVPAHMILHRANSNSTNGHSSSLGFSLSNNKKRNGKSDHKSSRSEVIPPEKWLDRHGQPVSTHDFVDFLSYKDSMCLDLDLNWFSIPPSYRQPQINQKTLWVSKANSSSSLLSDRSSSTSTEGSGNRTPLSTSSKESKLDSNAPSSISTIPATSTEAASKRLIQSKVRTDQSKLFTKKEQSDEESLDQILDPILFQSHPMQDVASTINSSKKSGFLYTALLRRRLQRLLNANKGRNVSDETPGKLPQGGDTAITQSKPKKFKKRIAHPRGPKQSSPHSNEKERNCDKITSPCPVRKKGLTIASLNRSNGVKSKRHLARIVNHEDSDVIVTRRRANLHQHCE